MAFVDFESEEEAQAACAANGSELDGRAIRVELSSHARSQPDGAKPFRKDPSEKPEGCTTCFIGNLSWGASEDMIAETFSSCGTVTAVRIAMDRESGRSKGYGHIEFEESDAADKAVAMAGTLIDGREVRVDYAAGRDSAGGDRGGRGGRGGFGGRGGGRGGFGGDRGGRGGRGGFGGDRGGRGGFSKPKEFSGSKVTFDD